jgi:hypothetical protein
VTETTPRDDTAPATSHAPLPALWWDEAANRLAMVDQTRLPGELVIFHPTTASEIAGAIRTLRVRGGRATRHATDGGQPGPGARRWAGGGGARAGAGRGDRIAAGAA